MGKTHGMEDDFFLGVQYVLDDDIYACLLNCWRSAFYILYRNVYS